MSFDSDDRYLLDHRGSWDNRIMSGDKVPVAKGTLSVPAAGLAPGSHLLSCEVPLGAVVKRVYYKVRTTFESATDAATIALQIEAADDVVAAVAISDGADPWDAGAPVTTLVDNAVANFLEPTARRELTAVVAGETLTAGEMDVWVEWAL